MNNNKWMRGYKRILTLALSASLILAQPVAAMDSDIPAESEAVTAIELSVDGGIQSFALVGELLCIVGAI